MKKHLFIENKESFMSEQNIDLLHYIFSLILKSIVNIRLFQITNKKKPLDITNEIDSILSKIKNIDFENTEIEFLVVSNCSAQSERVILSAYLMDNDGISLTWDNKLLPFISKRNLITLVKHKI